MRTQIFNLSDRNGYYVKDRSQEVQICCTSTHAERMNIGEAYYLIVRIRHVCTATEIPGFCE